MFFGSALIVGGRGVVRWGGKSYLVPAEIASFSSQDFGQNKKYVIFWHVVATGYFYVLFLWVIAVPDFCLLEIYNNLGLPLSTITFTVKSHADNHFYKYIYLFQLLYSIKSVFLLKSGSHFPKKNCVICLIESPLKIMKNAFYFILKALFVLKIFKF